MADMHLKPRFIECYESKQDIYMQLIFPTDVCQTEQHFREYTNAQEILFPSENEFQTLVNPPLDLLI